MREIVALGLCVGCGFRSAGAPANDEAGAVDGSVDSGDDASPDGSSATCDPSKVWFADFSVDPTNVDGNGDSIRDFAFRFTAAGTFDGGVFTQPGAMGQPLDTQPKDDFTTRTHAHVRMRNTSVGDSFGATFWINVNYQQNSFASLIASLRLDADRNHQTFVLYDKMSTGETGTLATVANLTTEFVDIDLLIDPARHRVAITVPPTALTTVAFHDSIRVLNDDRWATLQAFGGDSQFDSVLVELCR